MKFLRTRSTILLTILLCTIAVGCSKSSPGIVTPPADTTKIPVDTTKHNVDSTITASYSAYSLDSTFDSGTRTGSITDANIPEASGLAASRQYPGLFWTENDHGNPNTIFLIDSLGTKRATFTMTNCGNRDWEDLAIGPGPIAGVNYVYLAEIGDNDAVYPNASVYRFPEPNIAIGSTPVTASIDNAEKITFVYPDGPHNAETLMIDPLTKDLYIASKGNVANIYVVKFPQRKDTVITLPKLAILPLSTLTAGDISPNGNEILMKNYGQIYHWNRKSGETIVQALLRTPATMPYIPEVKGEGLCWSPNGNAYYTTGEATKTSIPGFYQYKRK